MKRLTCVGLALTIAACNGPNTGPTIDPSLLNLDRQIDGFEDVVDGEDEIDSYDVNMCVSNSGNIYVAWRDDREGPSDVWFNRSTDGGANWLPAPRRVKQGRGNATGVHMTCSGERVYVVWEDDRDGETGYENIYLNFTADGGDTWEDDDVSIDADPEGFAISLGPRVVIGQGKVHIVWYDQIEGAPDVYVATSSNAGKSFGVPSRVSGSREDGGAGEAWSGNPEIAMDSDGRLYVAWEDTKNGKQDIFFSGRADSEMEFGPQKRVDTGDTRGSNYSFAPRLEADGGHVYVVWHDGRSGEHRDIYMNYSADGGVTWLEEAVRVETDAQGFSESLNPDIIVEGDTAHIVWQDARNVGYDVFYRKSVAGDAASAEEEVRLDVTDDEGVGNSVQPRITKREDVIGVLWMDLRADGGDGYNDLYYAYLDLAEEEPAWSDDLRLDSIGAGSSFTEDHHMAIHEGSVYATWVDGRSGSRDVFFSSVLLGASVDSLELLAEAEAQAEAQGQQ
jgi:hypothetical protein